MNSSTSWYEDDNFWRTWGPMMFSKQRTANTPAETDQILALVNIPQHSHVLDLCCGIGRHSLELARRGFKVTGVDRARDDYEAAVELWRSDANIGLSSADNKDNIIRFLKRNPGLSKVAVIDGQIVATVVCGQDGRRGYLYHLYVDPNYRRKGLARILVTACLASLRKEKIHKCHLFIFGKNEIGQAFWNGTAWTKRSDINVFSKDI